MTKHRCKLSELQGKLSTPIDLFICQASYEARCLSIAKSIDVSSVKVALIGVNDDIIQHVGLNFESLYGMFNGRSQRVSTKMQNPLATADKWNEVFSKYWTSTNQLNVLVDITTLTHEALLILMELIRIWRRPTDSVTFCYASASEYDSGSKNSEKWLSKGVVDIRSVLGFPGQMKPTMKTHLIILVGYEQERASSLIQSYEPNLISLGHGKTGSHVEKRHEEASARFQELVSEVGSKYGVVEAFEFSCTRPEEVRDVLLQQAHKYSEYNVVIAPMNTKLSTIGCALAAWNDSAIQLCYAQAFTYNYANYSVPGDTCYLINNLDWPESRLAHNGSKEP